MARLPNPTPPARYPNLADINKLRGRLNVAGLCEAGGIDYGATKALWQNDREPPVEVYKPLRTALLALRRDIDKALGNSLADHSPSA